MDCIVHGAAKSQTQLSDFHFHFKKLNLYYFLNNFIYFCLCRVLGAVWAFL